MYQSLLEGRTFDPAKLREARDAAGKSQRELGELLGSRRTIEDYEAGRRTPDAEQICRLAKALKVLPDALLSGA